MHWPRLRVSEITQRKKEILDRLGQVWSAALRSTERGILENRIRPTGSLCKLRLHLAKILITYQYQDGIKRTTL